MIQKIVIQNFQSHEETSIEFAEGVNTIVGDSDVGKTAILRALFWVVFNRPLGTSFCSNWEHEGTYCQVYTTDGIITRVRTNTENYYMLDDVRYEAVGGKVPREIASILNLESINFSSQMDPPFFLSLSPGSRAAYLNDCVNLNIIDSSISAINSMVRDEQRQMNANKEDIQELKEMLDSYRNVPSLTKKFAQISQLHNKFDYKQKEIRRLEELIHSHRAVCETIARQKQFNKTKLREARRIARSAEALHEYMQALDYRIRMYKDAEDRYNDAESEIASLKEQLEKIPIPICDKCGQPIKRRRRRK